MKQILSIGVIGIFFYILSYSIVPSLTAFKYHPPSSGDMSATAVATQSPSVVASTTQDTREVIMHTPMPDAVRAIYMTSCVVGTIPFRTKLVTLIDETEINAVVIDIKDFSGTISFPPQSDTWKPAWTNARCGTKDMKSFLRTLHEKGIFVIGRITVFQDPFYTTIHPELAVAKRSDGTVWHDRKGLSFIDVGSKEYWDHIITLAADAYDIGFDELNFDYVRYPSDGNMLDIIFPNSMKGQYGMDKQANLEAFFAYLHTKLGEENRFSSVQHMNTGRASSTPYMSVDLFGMTTSNTDDLSIGQVLERAAPYFDAVAPMVYPSHYPRGFIGLANPNDDPYTVVHYAMKNGVVRMTASTTPVAGFYHTRIGSSTPPLYKKPIYTPAKLRTWIQDFDYGGDYDATDVRNQITASYDAGVKSFMIWSPSNIYTREALLPQ